MSLSFDRYPGCSPVYSDFNEYRAEAVSDTNLNISENSNDLSVQDKGLMELTLNLERERETYLEAVAVLHDQLRESHEQCQQLVNSHAELTRELEAEADDGWKEAKLWQEKYLKSCKIIKGLGIDVENCPNLTVVGSPETNISSMSTDDLGELGPENHCGTWVYSLEDNFEDFYHYPTLSKGNVLNCTGKVREDLEAKLRERLHDAWINLKTPKRFNSSWDFEYASDNSEPLYKTLELLKYIDY